MERGPSPTRGGRMGGSDMSEEEEGAKCCGSAFSAEVVTYAVCVHTCIHGVFVDWISA